MSESKNANEVSELNIATPPIQPAAIITYTDFKVISTEKKGRVTTALTVKLSAVSPGLSLGSGKNSPVLPNGENENEDNDLTPSPLVSPCALHRNVIKLDLTNKRHPKYIHPAVSANGRVSPGLLADPGEELLIQKIIQNHKKYSRDYLIGLRESKRALQLPVGLPNIPDLLPTSKQVVIVQTNSNAGPHKANHHKQGHHHNNAGGHNHQSNNQGGNHHANNAVHHQGGHVNTGYQNNNHNNNNNNNINGGYHNNRRNTVGAIQNNNQANNNYQNNNGNYSKYYNNQHHNNHFNTQNYGTTKKNVNSGYKPVQEQ